MASYHCSRVETLRLSRREVLRRSACGFGGVALAAMLGEDAWAAKAASPFAIQPTHFPARARSVIFLYMDGGPSQVDTFDPKPLLDRENGQPFKMEIEPTQFNNNGATLASPWKFRKYGECGTPVSDLFPHVAQHVDDMAVIRSMTSQFSEHTNANYFLHSGSGLQGRPSMGAWLSYGLGTECRDLPAFVVLNGGLIPPGGLDNFNSGFLPASNQASVFQVGDTPVANIRPRESNRRLQQNKLELVMQLDQQRLLHDGADDAVESAIANYELAFRMQAAVPRLTDLTSETEQTRELYGLNDKSVKTALFARECLLARRLVERGVRFVELTCPKVGAHDRWDQHSNLKQGHADNAHTVDKPIGALLTDLKNRGMLDETLVVWSGEFGRTPFAQGTDGRDHNPFGFSLWMAGGGVRGGAVVGATDEYGYKAIENKRPMHDLHATMLHLLGVDHRRLTYRFGGRDMRLTDVHGDLITEVLA
ncbi:MAG: DUF1501 domain-containing protein [Planctomycetales bacterium]|nr:DUF1501 domain-containing protein [Planctomycetales bacterium]